MRLTILLSQRNPYKTAIHCPAPMPTHHTIVNGPTDAIPVSQFPANRLSVFYVRFIVAPFGGFLFAADAASVVWMTFSTFACVTDDCARAREIGNIHVCGSDNYYTYATKAHNLLTFELRHVALSTTLRNTMLSKVDLSSAHGFREAESQT